MTQNRQQQIIQTVGAKIGKACPMCGHAHRSVQTRLAGIDIANEDGGFSVPGPMLTCVMVICQNCGFVSHHELGKLGL
jgi:predicted RNA-binding Zn-ribbon protein involved in translation (DUF1610 family)